MSKTGGIIHLLPDAVANQIAAGEVIQRPASVVKELVENAVDAGATSVQVYVVDAGKTSIQVVDNGQGMSETDARLAFERHATSKIHEVADLYALHTMGFRGEALASIAAVAQVELRTRLATEELGTKILIAGSKVESQEVVSCPKGSNFFVRNIFFNVPARRKFLKSNTTELSNILTEFERVALVHPDVSFSLHSNNSELFNLPATSLRQRIMAIFGKKMNQQLLNVEVETTMVKIAGYVGKPETARKKGNRQYFFVNGRYMRHPYFHHAVLDAYERLIPAGDQVSYFIYFEVDPANIDVNIHPTKTEIKFDNEQAIWQILSAAVKESLGKFSAIPTIDFDTEDMPDIPAFDSRAPFAPPPKVNYDASFNPFHHMGGSTGRATPKNWDKLYEGLGHASKTDSAPLPQPDEDEEQAFAAAAASAKTLPDALQYSDGKVLEKSNQYLQFKGRFILMSVRSGLMLIDQHRAHVRVLFDRYMNQLRQKQAVSQGVLFPEILQLSASEAAVLQGIMEELSAVGFDLSDLGKGSYAINGVPTGIEGLNPVELVRSMVHTAMEKGSDVKEEVQSLLALTLAKAAAIVYGQVLTNEEMLSLVDSLFASPSPNYTPDGKVIVATLREEDIEKLFK